MTQLWKLTAYCPECRTDRTILEDKDYRRLDQYRGYYQIMLDFEHGVKKCEVCGALYDSFIIRARYKRPETRIKSKF